MKRITLLNNQNQKQRTVVVTAAAADLEALASAAKSKLRLKRVTAFYTEDGTILQPGAPLHDDQRVLASVGERFVGAAPFVPIAQLAAVGDLHGERFELPGEKGAICWLPLGGGRLCLWHRPSRRSFSKLQQSGCSTICTLLGANEGADGIGAGARAAGLNWLWTELKVGREDYLSTDEAAERVTRAVADVQAALSRGESVLLHCSAGLHRTGTVAFGVLRACGWAPVEAKRGLQLMRPETAEQVGEARLALVERTILARVPPPHVQDEVVGGQPAHEVSEA